MALPASARDRQGVAGDIKSVSQFLAAQAGLFVANSNNARVLQYLAPVEHKLWLYLPLVLR